jgi:hypothetical protein
MKNVKNKLLLKISMAMFCVGLSACMEVKDSEQLKQQNSNQKTSSNSFNYYIPDSDVMNQFEVHLSLPNKNYVLIRQTISHGTTAVSYLTPDFRAEANSVYVDKEVNAGYLYKYSIGTIQNGQYLVENSIQVQIPFDLQVEKYTPLLVDPSSIEQVFKFQNIRKLVLSENAFIVTNGNNLIIKAQEIISLGGKILSFDEKNKSAQISTSGKSAGTVYISSRNAQGDLEINLDGQNGGDGTHGVNAQKFSLATDGGAGADGGNGGILRYNLPTNNKINLKVSIKAGLKGHGGKGGLGGNFTLCHKDLGCDNLDHPAGKHGVDGQDGSYGKICEAINGNQNSHQESLSFNCH